MEVDNGELCAFLILKHRPCERFGVRSGVSVAQPLGARLLESEHLGVINYRRIDIRFTVGMEAR